MTDAPHAMADALHTTKPTAAAGTWKLASVLLQYPQGSLFEGMPALRRAAAAARGKPARRAFDGFLDWFERSGPTEVAEHYVATFDLRRRCALYLTYYRFGDTRKRGMAMIAFKSSYRMAGFTPTDDELPDYLPLVLDFAALSPLGEKLLTSHRGDLELLHRALERNDSPYALLVEAVQAQLPSLGRRELAQVTKAWQTGPPKEDVGLEPFAPPEYLAGQRGDDSTAAAGYATGEGARR